MTNIATLPILTVIIPVYKAEKYLDNCIQSVLNQSLRDLEIILVDDGSPDRCGEMCDEYARQDERICVIHKQNAGAGFARNDGLKLASGKYVTFVDSDDYIETSAYETVCRLADEHGLDTLRFTCNRFTEEGRFLTANSLDGELRFYTERNEIDKLALHIFTSTSDAYRLGGSACMAIYARSVIEANHVNYPIESKYDMGEDFIFNFRFYLHANRVGYFPRTYYHYRVNMDSQSRVVHLDRMERVEKFSRNLTVLIRQAGFSEQDTLYALDYYVGMSRTASQQVFLSAMSMRERRAWFMKLVSTSYFREVVSRYPCARIPLKQRICLFAMKHRMFRLTYALIVGLTRLRSVGK